jgi:hypothetical protein
MMHNDYESGDCDQEVMASSDDEICSGTHGNVD